MTKVSILIAARNEAHTILDCLQSVEALSYPKENLQILVGNDASEDDTEQLVQNFITEKPYFQLINVINRENSINATLKGKANVLAHLAQHATGEYLFFTDADIEVPKDWIQNMLLHFKKNVGIVTGITTMKTPIFPKIHPISWPSCKR
ncbi:MAG: glycosyltransferase [Spirosomataceae bacterium]